MILLVHGFPTCSIDWYDTVRLLRDSHRVCAIDFPGYGFSDKPPGWGYSLARDAELLGYYAGEILRAESVRVVAHDRGTSVALNYVLRPPEQAIEHLVLTNGNIFLPLSNLTQFQYAVLDPSTAPGILDMITPELLATGMGTTTFSPPRPTGHPDVQALASTFAHADGIKVLHETIQYLVERAEHEQEWLELLASSDVPTTVIWGLLDTVSPPRVAAHVWDRFLMLKPGRNRFYLVPEANHYLQVDAPERFVEALLHTLDPGSEGTPGGLAPAAGSPVLVDCSRAAIPAARGVLTRAH